MERDRKQVSALTVGPDGERREVSLSTKGIERLDPQAARYDGTLWYHHGRPRPDLPQPGIETSHSFEQRRRQCDGAVMTTSGAQGFTQPTFETEPPVQ
ncbi:hypothetical protein GL279_13750 [Paracoccus limosus]|uniref:Uncharacterized protein n=1 Tax=Paracoccus limosus TaxID=913252 RepID=A0A844HAI0_9RHOB|nr:hypothetical protein [Paracoccus limosus]MTH35668.1 hypothetical protein [Paracoccus limosus]